MIGVSNRDQGTPLTQSLCHWFQHLKVGQRISIALQELHGYFYPGKVRGRHDSRFKAR